MPAKATSLFAALALPAMAIVALPSMAQERQLKDIFDKAQPERDKREVEDLIRRLEGGAKRPPGPSAPQAAPPPLAAPQPAPPASPPPVATTPPALPPPVAATPPAPPAAPPGSRPPEVLPPLIPPVAAPAPPPVVAVPTPPAAPPPPVAPPMAERPPAAPAPPPLAPPAAIERAPEMARRQELPSVDLVVFFEFNRSEITPQAAAALRALGQALADPRLAGSQFLIAGHTDARGSTAYNVTLSQARAEAVRRYVIENFKVDPRNLVARGFGESQLKNPRNPQADENRRVQIINVTGGKSTGGPAAGRAR